MPPLSDPVPNWQALLGNLHLALESLTKIAAALSAQAGNIHQTPANIGNSLSLSACETTSLSHAINELLVSKARIGRSDRYLRALQGNLASFARGRTSRPLASITTDEIEAWLGHRQWSARTRRNYLTDLNVLFNWCIRRGWIQRNPALAIEFPAKLAKPPALHSPDQVRAVLTAALAQDLDLARHLAVRYFAGLRTAEALRLSEEDLGSQYVEVKAHKAKTRQRRLVRITPNLRAWLDLGGSVAGIDPDRIPPIYVSAGVAWPPNVTRHSWASYHLAHWGSASRTALEAGHSEAVLFASYRELVTPEAAGEFWRIYPPG